MDNNIIDIIKHYPHAHNQVKVVKTIILQKGGRILEWWTSWEDSWKKVVEPNDLEVDTPTRIIPRKKNTIIKYLKGSNKGYRK